MNEINNFSYLFLKKVYCDLHLDEVEKRLNEENILSLNVQEDKTYKKISDYFFLLNKVDISRLNEEQKNKFHTFFSKNINELTEEDITNINEFMEEIYPIVLFPDVKGDYFYYGPVNDLYMCKKDSIALGLMYDCFSEGEDFEVENKLADLYEYIEVDLSKKYNKSITVIPYTQMTLEYNPNNKQR